jgi:hypothetical protein
MALGYRYAIDFIVWFYSSTQRLIVPICNNLEAGKQLSHVFRSAQPAFRREMA